MGNPYTITPLREDSDFFVNREFDLRIMVDKISRSVNSENIIISGKSRIGKTTLVRRLFNAKIQEQITKNLGDMKFVLVYIDINTINPEKRALQEIYSEMYKKAVTEIYKKYEIEIFINENKSIDRFKRFLHELSTKKIRLIVILDEFARLVKDAKITPDHLLTMRGFGQNRDTSDVFKYIVVSIKPVDELKKLYEAVYASEFGNDCYKMSIGPFNRENTIKLIDKSKQYKVIFTESDTNFILELSNGIPFLIQLICSELFDHKIIGNEITEEIRSKIKENAIRERERIEKNSIGGESPGMDISEIIRNGEDSSVEFKASALWSINFNDKELRENQKSSQELRDHGRYASKAIIAETIASFMNSYKGKLVIGIKVDHNSKTGYKVIGVNGEFNKLKDKNKDGYHRMIVDDIIKKYFGTDIENNLNNYLDITFADVETETVCIIDIFESKKPVFLCNDNRLWIKVGPEKKHITGQQLADYILRHFKN